MLCECIESCVLGVSPMCVYCEADMNSTTATVANNSATAHTDPCDKIIAAANDTAHHNKVYRSTDILFLKSIINCSDQTALNRQVLRLLQKKIHTLVTDEEIHCLIIYKKYSYSLITNEIIYYKILLKTSF